MIKCTCNREGEHCPQCGSVSKHPLIQRTSAAIGILKIEVRYYRCRKCGTEYGWYKGKFYEVECVAPPIARISVVKDEVEEFTKKMNEAIYFLRSYGMTSFEFKHGILEEPIDPDAKIPESKIEETKPIEQDRGELPEGYTRNEQGQVVAPMSSEELFAKLGKQVPPEERNENEDKNKDQSDS
jgi:hypothetical protein